MRNAEEVQVKSRTQIERNIRTGRQKNKTGKEHKKCEILGSVGEGFKSSGM
jgi:hypothetical protein